MVRGTLIALITLAGLGTLLAGAEARTKPRAPVAPPIERLVLIAEDAPGLAAKRASAALGQKAVARAMRPARLPKLKPAEISHFGRRGAELWSLAYTQTTTRAAKARTTGAVKALRRAGLRPRSAAVGQGGWLVTRKTGTVLVLWQRRNAVGEILLTAKLPPNVVEAVARQYASVADAHMEHLLSRSAWERTLGRIGPDGTVPRKVALDLFALAYRALPGTKAPSGPYGRVSEGTLAAREILRIWPTLTPAQQAAAAKALGIRSIRLGKGPSWRATHAAAGTGDYGDPTFKLDAALTTEIEQYVQIYVQKLKPAPQLKLKIVAGTTAEKSPTNWADALPVDADGNVTNAAGFCRVRLLPIGQTETNTDFRKLALAHEAFHCIQFEVMTPEGALLVNRRNWLLEGSADWAAISIVSPIGWDPGGETVAEYLDSPRRPLFSRVYDAVGFFGHAELMVGDLWPRVTAILKEATNDGTYSRSGGTGTAFLNSWGSSTFNLPKIGFDWYSTRPITTPPDFRPVGNVPIWADVELVDADPYALARYVIIAEAGLARNKPLLHVQIKGYARLGNTALDVNQLEDAWFWLGRGWPKCPPGGSGAPPPAIPLGREAAALALTGGLAGATGTVSFESLEKYCKEKQKPPKQASGGPAGGGGGGGGSEGGGGGSSFADPHLVTFDGYWYDFHGAGEFTLARSRSGDLEVQARQEPYPGTSIFSKALAINTAIAMRVAGDRVGVYMPDLSVRVNGRGYVPTRKARRLPRGGRIRSIEGQIEVVWPDGSLVRVFPNEGLGVLIQPVKARQGTLEGLFGNFDADTRNDFVTRSGTRLDADEVTSSFRLLYKVFGESWRITQSQSLFDYSRGQSTRTFTRRTFPNLLEVLRELTKIQRRMAEAYCTSLHIKRPEVFRACVIDVGATGNAAYATAAAQAERTGGGFPAPRKAGKPAKPAKPSKATTTWARVAAKATGGFSVQLEGGKVVAAYLNGAGSAEATTFTPSTSRDVVSVRRNAITSGWSSLGDPILVERPGGLQVLLRGVHGGLGDPLNGVSFAQRKADGSFGVPVLAATSTYAEFAVGKAVPAPDGAPLWAANRGGTLWLWRGATGAVGADLSGLTGGPAGIASLGRDRAGRYWLAWQTVFAAQAQRNGLYLQQFDPQTLKTIGSPQQAPSSSAVGYSGLPLACRSTCRLVYFQSTKSGLRIVSWAPGERGVTTVAAARAGHSLSQVAAAYSASGRLWVAWWDNAGNTGYGYRAVLGDARGAKGSSFSVGRPTDAGGAAVEVMASGSNLVLVTISKGPSPYVNVIAPR